jgi:transcriptional antiterminator RfaH
MVGLFKSGHGGARAGSGPKRQAIPPPIATPIYGSRWYCVRTGHELEHVADIEMRLAHFEVFAPMIIALSLRALRDGARSALEPLFARYLFVRFDRAGLAWREISRMRGVETILGSDGAPRSMPDEAINVLRAQCDLNDCIYAADPIEPDDFKPGCSVKAITGRYAGFIGIVDRTKDERVRILLTMLGAEVPVDVPRTDLVAV